MRKLAFLLIMAVFCVSARGEILVYNSTDLYESWWLDHITDTNNLLTGEWEYEKGQDKSFVVFDVNYSNPNIASFDSIKTINYWRDKYAIDPQTNPKGLLYKMDDMTANCHLIHFVQGGQVKTWILKFTDVGQLILITGKVKTMDIGLGSANKKLVAASLKGLSLSESTDEGVNVDGDITQDRVTMSLNAAWTKKANNSDPNKGFDGNMGSFLDSNSHAPQGLVNWLEAKGYKLDN